VRESRWRTSEQVGELAWVVLGAYLLTILGALPCPWLSWG
jgi:hypothetical protein